MDKISSKLKIVLVVLLVAFGVGAYFIWPKNNIAPQVAGAETQNDPNHPVEVYFGSSQFNNLPDMLADINITVYPEDKVIGFPPPDLKMGSKITITRATPVQVTDAKILKTYRTWAKTIKDLLAENNIGLLGKDSIAPAEETPITPDLQVKITRVAEVEVTQTEEINFPTQKKETSDMERGQSHVEQAGVKGTKEVVYLVKRVDGEEVSRKAISSKILTEPTKEILLVGTSPKLVHSGPYVDLLNAAAKKYDINATALQCLMLCESNGNYDSVAAAGYIGLFQYDPGFWGAAASAAGFGGAAWTDTKAQIFTTARLISIGQSKRWPPYARGCPRTNYQPCANR